MPRMPHIITPKEFTRRDLLRLASITIGCGALSKAADAAALGARGVAIGGGAALPYDAEVEWLRSNGGSYIKTGYSPKHIDIITTACIVHNLSPSKNIVFRSATGAWDSIPNYWVYVKFQYPRLQCWSFSPFQDLPFEYDYGSKIVIELNLKDGFLRFADSVSNINVGVESSNQDDVYLFGDTTRTEEITIYSFSVVRDGVCVCDMMPVRVGSVGFMYDRVSKAMFGNSGTGNFILGPDK